MVHTCLLLTCKSWYFASYCEALFLFTTDMLRRGRLPEKTWKIKRTYFFQCNYLIINMPRTSCQSLVTVAATVFLQGHFDPAHASISCRASSHEFCFREHTSVSAWKTITWSVFIVEHSNKTHLKALPHAFRVTSSHFWKYYYLKLRHRKDLFFLDFFF